MTTTPRRDLVAAWTDRSPAEPGRHWLDHAEDTSTGDLARAVTLGTTRPEGPGEQSMRLFRTIAER